MPRTVDFFDGQISSSAPALGSLNRTVTGTEASPVAITAGGGITIADVPVEMIFVEGSGGAVDITVDPQISAGTTVGQELNIYGTSNTNTVQLDDGNGLSLNGTVVLDAETNITLLWNGTLWRQER